MNDLNIDNHIQGFNSTLRDIRKRGMGLYECRQHTSTALKMILEEREIRVADDEYILIPKGRALEMVAAPLFANGGSLVMDVPDDLAVVRTVMAAGARVRFTGTRGGVMDMDALQLLCLTEIPIAVFVRSAASYLEGRSLPEEARNCLLELAARHQFVVICFHEHADMWLKVPRKPLLLRTAGAGIIYVSPLSGLSVMTDDLEIVVAHRAFTDILRDEVYSGIATRDPYMELAIARLVAKGKVMDDVQRLLTVYKTRLVDIHRHFKRFLAHCATFKASDAGLTIWVGLATPLLPAKVIPLLEKQDVYDRLANGHLDNETPVHALRISYADKGEEVWKAVFEALAGMLPEVKKMTPYAYNQEEWRHTRLMGDRSIG